MYTKTAKCKQIAFRTETVQISGQKHTSFVFHMCTFSGEPIFVGIVYHLWMHSSAHSTSSRKIHFNVIPTSINRRMNLAGNHMTIWLIMGKNLRSSPAIPLGAAKRRAATYTNMHTHRTLLHIFCSVFKMRLKWLVTMMKRYTTCNGNGNGNDITMSSTAAGYSWCKGHFAHKTGFSIWLCADPVRLLRRNTFFARLFWSRLLSMGRLMHLGCSSLCVDGAVFSVRRVVWRMGGVGCGCVMLMSLGQSHSSGSWNRNSMTT